MLIWRLPLDGKPNAVFIMRIERALEQLKRGRRGMWTKAIARDRCLVLVCAFYESSATGRTVSERPDKPVHRQYRCRVLGTRALLLAAIREEGCFSVVITVPNASAASIHECTTLMLCLGESDNWLTRTSLYSQIGVTFSL